MLEEFPWVGKPGFLCRFLKYSMLVVDALVDVLGMVQQPVRLLVRPRDQSLDVVVSSGPLSIDHAMIGMCAGCSISSQLLVGIDLHRI